MTLSLRQLNRATLARQLLLDRAALDPASALAQVAGLQAQVVNPPYIGLWTRLETFEKADLIRLIDERAVVRAPWLRSTLHIVTAGDFLRFRAPLGPALIKGLRSFFSQFIDGLDGAAVAEAMRATLTATPLALSDMREALEAIAPGYSFDALKYAVRSYLPLVQVPPGGYWGRGGSTAYTTADGWFGRPVDPSPETAPLVRHYLAAFGPASVRDMQAWAGMSPFKMAFEAQRGELRTYRSESGEELFDLPDLLLPDADTPAPARFLPEYDNLLLSHASRARVIADEHRASVYLSAGRVRATFLLDGFVRGTWRTEKTKKAAALIIEPFAPLSASDEAALIAEGDRLLRFIEDQAQQIDLRFEPHR